ncbi:MAG: calcium/sodium antiporter [Candidatus Cloacimonetes bacterium]|nr:calcium/sodium antiporter [Candidatus Cloacimonadota bacterium]
MFSILLPYILILIAFVLLAKGADFFISGASNIAKYFRVSPLFIGLTLAAIGTSAPEAAVSIKASIAGANGIALGNIVGSNIANICLAIGIAALIKPLYFEDSTIQKEIPFMILITVLLFIFGINFSHIHSKFAVISRFEGIILLLLFIGFLIYLSRMAVRDRKNNISQVQNKDMPILKNILLVSIGGIAIAFGGHLAVENAVKIARMWDVSPKVIGISVVALGTSIPEIVTSIVAVTRGKISIAVGNIVGSNIFNILFVLGIASSIHPITLSSNIVIDIVICLGIAVLFFVFSKIGKNFRKVTGIILLICYVFYILFLFRYG